MAAARAAGDSGGEKTPLETPLPADGDTERTGLKDTVGDVPEVRGIWDAWEENAYVYSRKMVFDWNFAGDPEEQEGRTCAAHACMGFIRATLRRHGTDSSSSLLNVDNAIDLLERSEESMKSKSKKSKESKESLEPKEGANPLEGEGTRSMRFLQFACESWAFCRELFDLKLRPQKLLRGHHPLEVFHKHGGFLISIKFTEEQGAAFGRFASRPLAEEDSVLRPEDVPEATDQTPQVGGHAMLAVSPPWEFFFFFNVSFIKP